jgi:hypothetical protein
MKNFPDATPMRSDLSNRTVTMNLILHGVDRVSLRSCEIVARSFRNRLSFQDIRLIEEVLVARIANAIKSCLQTLPDGAHVLALPDFLVEVPGLALSGVHVMVQEAKMGVRSAILRFTEFLGAINNAFRFDIGMHEPKATHSEKLAVNVLAEVCLPILNLYRSLEQLDRAADRRRIPDLSDRMREFEFQTELLKRFIFNSAMGHAEAADIYLTAQTVPPPRHLPG